LVIEPAYFSGVIAGKAKGELLWTVAEGCPAIRIKALNDYKVYNMTETQFLFRLVHLKLLRQTFYRPDNLPSPKKQCQSTEGYNLIK